MLEFVALMRQNKVEQTCCIFETNSSSLPKLAKTLESERTLQKLKNITDLTCRVIVTSWTCHIFATSGFWACCP